MARKKSSDGDAKQVFPAVPLEYDWEPKDSDFSYDEFSFNRVLKSADYELFGVNTRKEWEVRMALDTLRNFGATSPEAWLLGVGAGREETIYHLANEKDSRFVFATDLYADAGVWEKTAGGVDFLRDPMQFSRGIECDPRRIVPRHADMCDLPFEDNMFDGIFSSGSIEHVGKAGTADWDAISKAAKEIGRVLKPGGVASISTEWRMVGDGWGWGHVRLFDMDTLYKYVIEPSGLELIDMLDTAFDGDLDKHVVLGDLVRGTAKEDGHTLIKGGHESGNVFIFTSVHLALRK
jgi:SAM-dependent methyltransferase